MLEKMLCRILLNPAGQHCSTRSVMICVELEKDFPCQSTRAQLANPLPVPMQS